MSITFEEVQRLLAQAPSKDAVEALKQWRAQMAYSQGEAAIRLGVPLRTLQGWELGRPMPYPTLLQRAVPTVARPMNRYALSQADFPREFAEFIDFVGAGPLDKQTRTVEQRLRGLSPAVRAIYGDRYFFPLECRRFTHQVPAFGLDVTNSQAVRAASLMAGINRVRRLLSPKAADRLRARLIGDFDHDMRQLEHEIGSWTHFARKGFNVVFAELERGERFDLLVETSAGSVAVECKTVCEDTGDQIKIDLAVNLANIFDRSAAKLLADAASGQFVLTLKKPADECKHLPRRFEAALKTAINAPFEEEQFSLTFYAKPDWQALLDAGAESELERQIQLVVETDASERFTVRAITPNNKVFEFAIRSHAPTRFGKRLVKILKDAADQCPSSGPGAVWVHFVGVAEADFRALCNFSMNGGGAGLNAVVAEVLHPRASTTDRSHVQRIIFSAQNQALTPHPMLDADLMLIRTVSHSVTCFDVPNPKCKFAPLVEI